MLGLIWLPYATPQLGLMTEEQLEKNRPLEGSVPDSRATGTSLRPQWKDPTSWSWTGASVFDDVTMSDVRQKRRGMGSRRLPSPLDEAHLPRGSGRFFRRVS